jgi:hypothetical protein
MNKVEVYNSDYTKVNHAYIQIYETYEKLIQCPDADEEILCVMEAVLRALNPALDKIKSEMTVQTRYKDGSSDVKEDASKKSVKVEKETTANGGVILKGKFN